MSSETSEQVAGFEPVPSPPAAATHPMLSCLRRELWENRSIYVAPLLVAAVVVFATFLSMAALPRKIRQLPRLAPAQQHAVVVKPFAFAPAPIMLTTFLVGLFYSLDALYGERRDRSILFWKSLPVSDRMTVLSKAGIPLAVLPLIAFVLGVAALMILLLLSTVVLLASGVSPAPVWRELQFVQEPMVMLYGLTAHTLWFAPIYAWLLLLSAWVRRAPFLWAVLPPLAIAALERIAFNTKHFLAFLQYRVTGAMAEAFDWQPAGRGHGTLDRITQLAPGRFLTAPGLWLGLAFAAACIGAAVRLRRHREPI